MVKLLFLLVLTASSALAGPEVQFRTEFSKNEFYVGEHVMCNFVLYAHEDILEAEVAKFPEFRGYWSENLVLRQGPISLVADMQSRPWKKALIGTYLLTSMLGKNDPSIEPLKLVVRQLGNPASEISLDSVAQPVKIKPLPPIPEGVKAFFHGAVGNYSFFLESSVLAFQKDEPLTLRYLLQGEGNFQEVNEIPLPVPAQVEILSKKSFTQGTDQYATKTFEFTVAVHSDQPVLVPEVTFAYFNPLTKRYETVQTPPLSLQWQAPLSRPDPEKEPLELGSLETTWSSARPLQRSVGFWLFQALCAACLIAVAARRIARKRRRRHFKTASFQQSQKLQSALAHWEHGDLEQFLRLADELAFELVCRGLPHSRDSLTRTQAVRLGRDKLGADTITSAETLFRAYEIYAYSPQKTLPSDLRALREALTSLVQKAA